MAKKRPLTAKQQKFCEEYMIDLNATQAALRAGYCARTVNKTGPANLVKIGIKEEIARLKAITSEKTGITVEYVVNNLKEVAERCMNASPVLDFDGNATGEWQFDAGGANRALQLLGMHVGAFEADNAQKAPEVRIFSLTELRQIVLDDDKRNAEIIDISQGLAE